MTRPIRSYPDEVEALAVALRDELRMEAHDAAELATYLIDSDWFEDLVGFKPCDRPIAPFRPERGES